MKKIVEDLGPFLGELDKLLRSKTILIDLGGRILNRQDLNFSIDQDLEDKIGELARMTGPGEGFLSHELPGGRRLFFLPKKDYILCLNNLRDIEEEEGLKNGIVDILPGLSELCGGEAVLFDSKGLRLMAVNTKGEVNRTYIGYKSREAREAMETQRPVLGESNTVLGSRAIRIPVGRNFGIGFNNEDSIRKASRLMKQVKDQRTTRYDFDDILGESPEIKRVKKLGRMASKSLSNVLIYGETGTGKELMAQSIHSDSSRSNKAFIAINCAAIPKSLIESTFFGYEKGAFTGAKDEGSKGIFEQANGGTIFLDEISEMDLDTQSKILRVIQEREVRRLGCKKVVPLDIRIIAATNKDLRELCRQGDFREDLYFRLNVVDIRLPALREIRGDIPVYIEMAIRKMNKTFGKFIKSIDSEALELLSYYNWPGNMRELLNCIEKSFNVVQQERIIRKKHIPRYIREYLDIYRIKKKDLEGLLDQYEKEIIRDYLKKNDLCKSETARDLNISTVTLWRRIKKYDLEYLED